MSKIKTILSEVGCCYCGLLYPAKRAEVYKYCKPCAERYKLDAKKTLPILCTNKGAYQAYSHEDARNILNQANPKRTM